MKKEELKPGDELPLYCKFCKKITKCRYNGIQKDWHRKPKFHLFTCLKCKSTFAEKIK